MSAYFKSTSATLWTPTADTAWSQVAYSIAASGYSTIQIEGRDIGIYKGDGIFADRSTITIATPHEVVLKRGGRIDVTTAGALVIGGTDASLSKGMRLSVESYNVDLEAPDETRILKGWKINATATGEIAILGTTLSVAWLRRVVASSGAITLSGKTVTLTLVPQLYNVIMSDPKWSFRQEGQWAIEARQNTRTSNFILV